MPNREKLSDENLERVVQILEGQINELERQVDKRINELEGRMIKLVEKLEQSIELTRKVIDHVDHRIDHLSIGFQISLIYTSITALIAMLPLVTSPEEMDGMIFPLIKELVPELRKFLKVDIRFASVIEKLIILIIAKAIEVKMPVSDLATKMIKYFDKNELLTPAIKNLITKYYGLDGLTIWEKMLQQP